jgi:hypothetical protein
MGSRRTSGFLASTSNAALSDAVEAAVGGEAGFTELSEVWGRGMEESAGVTGDEDVFVAVLAGGRAKGGGGAAGVAVLFKTGASGGAEIGGDVGNDTVGNEVPEDAGEFGDCGNSSSPLFALVDVGGDTGAVCAAVGVSTAYAIVPTPLMML